MPQDARTLAPQRHDLVPVRCSDGTRTRGDQPYASAIRYRRFLLLEVPGPWGRSALEDSRLDASVVRPLVAAADASDYRVLLIRRPGRHASAGSGPLAWAVADTSDGAESVRWGNWRTPADLLDIDLTCLPLQQAGAPGPRRLALVCTNGKRDPCCALLGRPVAAAVAAAGWDAWECSHLGGHRYAANLLLLPYGDMFGQLDPDSARAALRQFDAGQIMLSNYRGRCGQPFPVQAALHAAAVRLGDCRRGAIRASSIRQTGDRWEVEVSHRAVDLGTERAYRVTVGAIQLAPTLQSCGDAEPKPETRYEALAFAPAP